MLRLMQGSQTSELNNLFSISPPTFPHTGFTWLIYFKTELKTMYFVMT
uniref:Uncharacterized protein n=1 Tax=Anguilla anguilla TaxID=7936 RepID=A0A0E9SFP9_ANGAN